MSWLRAAAADFLLCALIAAVCCALYFSGLGGVFALNSDIVMPYVVYADAVKGWQALSGWIMPESPYWFPDLLATWAIYAGASLLSAVNVFAFLQVVGYLLLARWVLGLIDPASGRLAWRIFLLAWLAAFLIGMHTNDSWFDRFGHYVFVPYTHAGALLITLASLGLLLSLQRNPRRIAPIVVLIALAIPTVISDRLYAIECLLAMLGLAVLPILHPPVRLRLGGAAFVVLVVSEAWRWISGNAATTSRYGPINAPMVSLAQMAKDFSIILHSNFWASAIVIAGSIALLIALGQACRRWRDLRLDADASSRAAAAVFITLAIMLPLAAGVVLGRYTAMDSFRYCQTLGFVLLPLAWLLAHALKHGSDGHASRLMAGASALVTVAAASFGDISEAALRTEWRAQADCIDAAHEQYGLHNGLSRYWHANSLNARVRVASRLFAVSADFESTPINKNIDWIGARAEHSDHLPVLDFIDEFQFDPGRLDETFGEPTARVSCPLSTIRIYAPSAGMLGKLYARNDWLPQETLVTHGRMAVPAAAWMQAPAQAEADGLRAVDRFPDLVPVLMGGIESPRPVTRAWIDYRLEGASNAEALWEAVALDASGNMVEVLASGRLEKATEDTHYAFDLPRRSVHGIGLSIVVRGAVDLHVRALGMASD